MSSESSPEMPFVNKISSYMASSRIVSAHARAAFCEIPVSCFSSCPFHNALFAIFKVQIRCSYILKHAGTGSFRKKFACAWKCILKRSMQALKAPSATTVCISGLYFTKCFLMQQLYDGKVVDSQSSSNNLVHAAQIANFNSESVCRD